MLVGNHLVIEIADGRYVLLAHLMEGSVVVTERETVYAGQLIAKCGNSGNTSEPHLHIQIQNLPDWTADELETYSMEFQNIRVTRWGTTSEKPQGELMRNDLIHTPDAPGAE